MGFFGKSRQLVSAWADNQIQRLQGTPNTRVDSGGTINEYEFRGQDIDRSELRDVKQIRESGGVISHLVHAKALMIFGTGVEWQTENEEIAEYLNDELDGLDNLLIDLGEDAIWYPYSAAEIVETQAGGFSHIEPVEPWTLLPQENEFGEVIAWEQEIQSGGFGSETEVFQPDEIASFILNKSSGRDKTGISEVLRAEEEITQFRENREAVNKAIEIAGFPHHIWKVGEEGGPAIDDNELRRVRNRVDNMEGDTQFVMGTGVDHELIQPGEFKFEAIQEHDLREVALALGLPLELANVGSDGLGSGMPADLRLTLFERQARASQRRIADQFVEQVARVILRDYSPYNADELEGMTFGDPISDREENSLTDLAPWMTNNEIREEMDKEPAQDDEIGDSYRKPADIQSPEGEGPEDGGGIGGLFRDARGLAEVPENANPIDDPSECDGQVVTGPRGGTYCVPSGGGAEGGSDTSPSEVESQVSEIVESGDHSELESFVSESVGVDDVSLPPIEDEEQATRFASTLSYAGEAGLTEEVEEINVTSGDEIGVYRFNDGTLSFNMNIDETDLDGAVENGEAVGEDLEWLVLHELGHATHNGEVDDIVNEDQFFDNGLAVSRDGEWVGRERVDMVDDEVSAYARTNPAEFVAEVFSGLAMGQEYSDEVMDMYEEWGGPDEWQNYGGNQ